MVLVSRVARVVVLLALLWSLGCLGAAVNWHSNWLGFVRAGAADSPLAIAAQERWQHWVDLCLLGVLVTVGGLVAVFWEPFRRAGHAPDRDDDDADHLGV